MADCGLLLRAVFISELKNRFRCIVRLNGEEILCYVPSSCKLNNFIELVGRSVLVKKMASSTGLEYTLFALETPRGLVLLNLAMANEVLEYQIQRRFFSFLGSRKHVRREVIIDGYKSDLYIDDTDTVIGDYPKVCVNLQCGV